MKQIIKNIFYSFLDFSNGFPFKNIYSGNIQILMFHRVVDDIGTHRIMNDGIEVTKDYLDFLIQFYKSKGFTPISINELENIIHEKTKKRYVIFSFDDGYKDNLVNALPVFEKHEVPFVIYIPIDFITRKQFAWWYYLEDILKTNSEINITINGVNHTKKISEHEQKKNLFIELRKLIQEDNTVLKELMLSYPKDLKKYHDLFLDNDDLKKLSTHTLVSIGSHSISHPSLAKISLEQAENEIFKSKEMIEQTLNISIEHFSFPFGTKQDVTQREIDLIKKAGYKTGLTTSYGDTKLDSNIHKLPRIWTSNDHTKEDLKKIIYGINEYTERKK